MLRRSFAASWPPTSTPSTRMVPPVGSISRLIMRSTVDLPHPDGPMRTVVSPAARSIVRPSTATVPSGYCLRTRSRFIGAAVRVPSTYVLSRRSQGGQSLVLVAVRAGQRRDYSRRAHRARQVHSRSHDHCHCAGRVTRGGGLLGPAGG